MQLWAIASRAMQLLGILLICMEIGLMASLGYDSGQETFRVTSSATVLFYVGDRSGQTTTTCQILPDHGPRRLIVLPARPPERGGLTWPGITFQATGPAYVDCRGKQIVMAAGPLAWLAWLNHTAIPQWPAKFLSSGLILLLASALGISRSRRQERRTAFNTRTRPRHSP